MKLLTASALTLIILSLKTFGQVKDQNIRLQVLKHNIIGREFVFKSKDNSTTQLTYLGFLHSKKGTPYKIMNSVWLWGQAHRATSRILIFNKDYKYFGNYPLTMIDDLPSFIKDDNLVFTNKQSGSNCDTKLTTCVNFKQGIPNKVFRKCSGNDGDIYTFNKE
jgi:hypothetical protein